MSDDDNPYRFVEAVEYEESAESSPVAADEGEERWDLRAYVAPPNEPIYSPAEIAELGRQWSGIAFSTFMDLFIVGIATALTAFMYATDTSESATIGLLIYSCIAVTGFRILLWTEAYCVLLALRYARDRSALAATLYAVPIANLSLLFPLRAEAVAILRRHGIPAGFWRVAPDALPRRVEKKSGDDA